MLTLWTCRAVVAVGLVLAGRTAIAQTNATEKASPASQGTKLFSIEALIMEPADMGVDAKRSVDGMVINVKSPVKVIANDNVYPAASSGFQEKNREHAAMGIHSWLSVSYKLEEAGKRVTVYVFEFEDAEKARRIWTQRMGLPQFEEDPTRDLELKGSLFYKFLRGSVMLSIEWAEPKPSSADRIITAYKSKLLSF